MSSEDPENTICKIETPEEAFSLAEKFKMKANKTNNNNQINNRTHNRNLSLNSFIFKDKESPIKNFKNKNNNYDDDADDNNNDNDNNDDYAPPTT